MGIYTKTVTTTYANLKFALQGLTADANIIVSDPQNAIIGNVSTSGTLGYIIKNNGSKNVDFSDTDFSSASLANKSKSINSSFVVLLLSGKYSKAPRPVEPIKDKRCKIVSLFGSIPLCFK